MNLVIFDFCETIVPFQSADDFVKFVNKKSNQNSDKKNWFSAVLNHKIVNIFFNKLFPKYNYNKRKVLNQLNGLTITELEKFAKEYSKMLEENVIEEMMGYLEMHKKLGDEIIIISGGYHIYLKYFAESQNLNGCYATKIRFKNEKCMGTFEGLDCMYDEKVKHANSHLNLMKIKPQKTIVYTDSVSDLSLMQWADEGIVVSKHPQKWANQYNFKEIIWK